MLGAPSEELLSWADVCLRAERERGLGVRVEGCWGMSAAPSGTALPLLPSGADGSFSLALVQ